MNINRECNRFIYFLAYTYVKKINSEVNSLNENTVDMQKNYIFPAVV